MITKTINSIFVETGSLCHRCIWCDNGVSVMANNFEDIDTAAVEMNLVC